MAPSLTILGGGGWFPAYGRLTACALLRNGPSATLIDAGSGLVRLVEQPSLVDGVEELDIVMTHFHLDHVVGLSCLPALRPGPQITVWGPGEQLFGRPTADILGAVAHEPYHPVPLEKQGIEVREIPAEPVVIGGNMVRSRRQEHHSCPTLGLRFDDYLTWITDTGYDHESAGFARGSRVLAHEAWFVHTEPRTPDIHSSAAEAAAVARLAGVDELLLIHLPPFTEGIDHLLAEAEAAGVPVHAALDGSEVRLAPAPPGVGGAGPLERRRRPAPDEPLQVLRRSRATST